ncbi:Xaa-Pro peptidase family protein [Sporolactobacillus shoreicorticis]|uniref:M24 family metallopeptidase n=1 Tax=Sporolactobacillus shoreicorticis TaxID=1923877 RepID=A0ABW5S6N2_9BACL|nr:Xaa-Pro peptidase family protein [Sporolactobacillus shoreicorticis]MCO7124269.1 Xaa-Pro peptidase family protein [Sporolactobacillus shoreicorticis]
MNRQRLNRVLKNMEEEHLKQILVTSTASVYYLTGYWVEPIERLLALYIQDNGKAILFGNELFDLVPREGIELVLHSDSDNPVADLTKVIKPGEIGIDKFWPSSFLINMMKLRQDVVPVPGSGPVDHARMLKDEEEIAQMRHASQINDMIMEKAMAKLQPGIRENEISMYIEKLYAANGGDHSPEGQIVSFGANAADPHHWSADSILKEGDGIVFDIFNPIKKYWCDMTRTVFFRKTSDEQRKVYETVKEANLAAEAMIRPGIPMSAIDLTARRIIEHAGYGKYFTHRLGHGCGLECHEIPDNSSSNHMLTQPGMIFSVEPGIYIPGETGVRIEDLVLVTEDGCEVLNAVSKDLKIIE